MTCCSDCTGRKDMVLAASAFMNATSRGEARSITLTFEDGYVATGKFDALHEGYFTFENNLNAAAPPGTSSERRWRKEDHPYCMVKRIQRDHYEDYVGGGE